MREVKSLDKGICKYCGRSIYWTRTAKNNKPAPVEIKGVTGFDKYGDVVTVHEAHQANCPDYPSNPKGDKK